MTTTDTGFADELATALAGLDVGTDLVRVARAEFHKELAVLNAYGTLLCRVGSCQCGGVRRGALRVYGYAPDLRTVPVGDCGGHEVEQVAIALVDCGRYDAESRATYPEAWQWSSAERWIGYR